MPDQQLHPARSLSSVARTPAQARILAAALDLFADHGVSGTSLQMIADAIGVTKAAVYHKFKTKEEIVVAVAETEMAALEVALEAAEAEGDSVRARKVLLIEVVGMAVERRRWVMSLQNDPAMVRVLGEHAPLRDLTTRLYAILLDEPDDTEMRIAAALFSGAIASTVVSPLVDSIDDATLCSVLIALLSRMFRLPD
ncbi:helix-turn-helix domain-containing protein [Candidatus Mycobacterium wuenschmannii]|uniref:Helix-turn-helix domain-containing protein n=1 Tax=Candidatus Mycobacterium wuenschmannii TaxID=3027808 RepID=A0ABY8W3M3_9MYCO|nr:TetR/AcrR family transcriptional regulator [Candidatus Mycobacterium wuenschmannii]WIM89062.1 helix-turn-helix domain-containing protein [Candidatus Mycobacterium wuenschmannii]